MQCLVIQIQIQIRPDMEYQDGAALHNSLKLYCCWHCCCGGHVSESLLQL